jgi:hypothetical protein
MADVPSDDGSWEDRLAGDRVFWPSFGTLPECSCYVPADRSRQLAYVLLYIGIGEVSQ